MLKIFHGEPVHVGEEKANDGDIDRNEERVESIFFDGIKKADTCVGHPFWDEDGVEREEEENDRGDDDQVAIKSEGWGGGRISTFLDDYFYLYHHHWLSLLLHELAHHEIFST